MASLRAIVLCPGPSLAAWLPMMHDISARADMVIGVNRAIEAYPCDYACSIDPFDHNARYKVQGTPKRIITQSAYHVHEQNGYVMDYGLVLEDGKHKLPDEKAIAWKCASSVAAMLAAYNMGCNRVDYYGCDMHGVDDYKGNATNSRYPARWERESYYFGIVTEWLKERDVMIIVNTI